MSLDLNSAVTGNMVAEIIKRISGMMIKGKTIPQLVRVINQPVKFRYTKLKRASITGTAFPDLDSPDIEIKNPLDREVSIKHVTLIPDGTAKTNIMIKLFVNDVLAFDNDATADFTDIAELKIEATTGKKIEAGKSVKLLAKTSAGTSKIALAITFGD